MNELQLALMRSAINSLNKTGKLLVTGLLFAFSGFIIKLGITGTEVTVPFLGFSVPSPLASALFNISAIGVGWIVYGLFRQTITALRRLEFDEQISRNVILANLMDAAWLSRNVFLRNFVCLYAGLFVWVVLLLAPNPLLVNIMGGLIFSLPYWLIFSNSRLQLFVSEKSFVHHLAWKIEVPPKAIRRYGVMRAVRKAGKYELQSEDWEG